MNSWLAVYTDGCRNTGAQMCVCVCVCVCVYTHVFSKLGPLGEPRSSATITAVSTSWLLKTFP